MRKAGVGGIPCGRRDVASVGGKNASLGEMVRNLGRDGIKVPPLAHAGRDGEDAVAERLELPFPERPDLCH